MISCPLHTALSDRIPELAKHLIEIVAVARNPGSRAKVAVRACIPGINPVAVCIGWGGLRITDVEKRLNGERVSIVAYVNDPATYVTSALGISAATAHVIDAGQHKIRVYVDPENYCLAVGKAGHNVHLARELTGWNIEILARNAGLHSSRTEARRLALSH
ncbi:Transcription termination/antitermination protein NusA [Mycobacterium persicum]|uniref:Transcription termination/antitermination protein NusA n=1 Tax=Mycobacterium persicum TaxID=1487726 RepID=A0ABY6RS78_9MYCO|nr:nucleic acid-binding protein [Mycobacterium persicum]VBA32106.1 Transcription termination/antitermination protein NusA [Mycobacterium persicum]